MVKEIRVYVEGGGRGEASEQLREGFRELFKDIREAAKSKHITVRVIPCAAQACGDFEKALRLHRDAFNILLIDTEGPLTGTALDFIRRKNPRLRGVSDEQCHLMVQLMEAWFIADIGAGELLQARIQPKRHTQESKC